MRPTAGYDSSVAARFYKAKAAKAPLFVLAHGAALNAPGESVHLRHGVATLVGRPPFEKRLVEAVRLQDRRRT